MAAQEPGLLTTFRFGVTLQPTRGGPPDRGGFAECSGLDYDLDVLEYAEGGANDRVVRRVGRAKFQPLVLRRGMLLLDGKLQDGFWRWIQETAAGRPVRRYHGTIELQRADGQPAARWEFDNALPLKIVGPRLSAQTGEVAVEELHLAHEGLRLAVQEP